MNPAIHQKLVNTGNSLSGDPPLVPENHTKKIREYFNKEQPACSKSFKRMAVAI
jgi:hypothetical protein